MRSLTVLLATVSLTLIVGVAALALGQRYQSDDSDMWSEQVPLPNGGYVTCVGLDGPNYGGGLSCDWP